MWFIPFVRPLHLAPGRHPRAGCHPSRKSPSVLPRLELLEDRTVPSTLTVLNNLDSGAGSLRYAIGHSRDGDTIVFAPDRAGQTITLTSGSLDIKRSLDIEGPGAGLLAVSGNNTSRVFDLGAGLTVNISGLTITHGRGRGSNGGGGGILNVGSSLTLTNDVFSYNQAIGSGGLGRGGAVSCLNDAALTVTDSTFVGNLVLGGGNGGFAQGGGIFIDDR